MQFLFRDYRPLFPDRITVEEHFSVLLGRELIPEERHYLALAEAIMGPPRSWDAPADRTSNVTPISLKRKRAA